LSTLASVSRAVERHAVLATEAPLALARAAAAAATGAASSGAATAACRMCFNLLDDVDYHLKEAAEKSARLTARFQDKLEQEAAESLATETATAAHVDDEAMDAPAATTDPWSKKDKHDKKLRDPFFVSPSSKKAKVKY